MDKTKKPEEKKPKETAEVEASFAKASPFVKTTEDKSAAKEVEKECSCKEECKCCKKKCEQCEEFKKQGEEYKTKYLRAIADYQNYERHVQDQRIEWIKNANKDVVLKLLSFLDDLERAEVFVTDPDLSHVKESFVKMLTNEGLEEIKVLNKPYDPYTAEVIDIKEGEKDNVIVAVLRKGYTYNGQLLRIAQVTVSKKIEKKL